MYHINHRILRSKHFGSPKTEPYVGLINAFTQSTDTHDHRTDRQ